MHDNRLIGPWIRRFLMEHLVTERNLAHNTQVIYRDTLLQLLPFLSQTQKKAVDQLTIDGLSPSGVRAFLEHVAWCAEIRAVPFKKTAKSTLTYLDKPEKDALPATPDQHTPQGRRNYTLLLFLYNTGARVSDLDAHPGGFQTHGCQPLRPGLCVP